MMKIKIIADSVNKFKTGIGNYTFNLITGLQQIGAGLSLINYEKVENFHTELYPNILKDRFLETYSWYLTLPFLIKPEPPAIIHNPTQVPTFFRFKHKNIITINDLSALKFPEQHKLGRRLITDLFLPRTLKKADKIIAISRNTKEDILSYYPFLKEDKIRVIHLAANEDFRTIQDENVLDDCRKRYNLHEKFILYVGTLEPRKNLVRLLHAFSSVHEKTGVPLTIVGKKGWKYKKIFETLRDLNLEQKVLFTGYVEPGDLPALYNLATLFVYPSLYEGFGLPPLEAMQCGCPVITSNVSSLPEVVGDAAIKVNPCSIQEIEQAMCSLLSDENLRTDYIKRGIKQAEKFSWERCARETFQVYQEVWNED